MFALMFIAIARNPVANRGMIVYGILLKLSYCGLVFWYWFGAVAPGSLEAVRLDRSGDGFAVWLGLHNARISRNQEEG